MAFLNNSKFKDIFNASKNGNEKALMIVQAMKQNRPQTDVDRLVDEYYKVVMTPTVNIEQEQGEALPPVDIEQRDYNPQEIVDVDLTEILDKETDGLFDEIDVEDITFPDFIKTKQKNLNREKKNADYFKAYDVGQRQNYMNGKIDKYKNKFVSRLDDIERRHKDTNSALNLYMQKTTDFIDDNIDYDMNMVSSAYNDFVNNEDTMHSFGRHWDERDNEIMEEQLKDLVAKYGKKNVLNVLNTLRADNDSYRDYMNNQVDSNIGKYSKSVENILK